MGKIAFVFSGQGAQYSGMGKSLYETSNAVKKLYDECEEYRTGTKEQSFSGSDEELKITSNTQPCLYLVDLSAALALNEKGIYADGTAGFSLGEIAALAYSGAYSYTDGFRLVTKRGELMSSAALDADTSMMAVLKLDSKTVSDLASEFDGLYAVNYNCPGQVVIAGAVNPVNKAIEALKAAGAKRAVLLPVSAPFHSTLMQPAAARLAEVLAPIEIKDITVPVVANVTAQEVTSGEEIKKLLVKQAAMPVLWETSVRNMVAGGVDIFVEVGPGKVLTGFTKKIAKGMMALNVEDAASLEKTLAELNK